MNLTLSHGLRPGNDETPTSYCSRVALLNGRSLLDFCRDIGVKFMAVALGDARALSIVTSRCGLALDVFERSAVVGKADQTYSLGQQTLKAWNLLRLPLRVCPECLGHDLQVGNAVREARPYGRAIWQVTPIGVCFDHHLELQVVSSGMPKAHDFAANLQAVLTGIAQPPRDLRRRPTAFESYLRRRLSGRPAAGGDWLDDLPFYAAVRACEIVGGAALHGRHFGAPTANSTEAGFEVLRKGPEGIRDTLRTLAADFQNGKADWGPRSIFGRLYGWLAHEDDDPCYAPLRDTIRDFAIETIPIGPGDRIFGENVPVRRNHSIRSASLATGMHPKRLRKLLELRGLIGAESGALSDDRVLFKAEAARPFLEHMPTAMSLAEAERYIGARRPHGRLLFEAGFITPIEVGGTDVLKDHAFAKEDLDRLLFDLLGATTGMSRYAPDMKPINVAARHVGRSTTDIVRLVINGRLNRLGRDDTKEGYTSVLVHLPEVIEALDDLDGDLIEIRTVCRIFRMRTPDVIQICEAGFIEIHRNFHSVENKLVARVSKAETLQFLENYVFLRDVSSKEETPQRTRDDLKSIQVEPIYVAPRIQHTLYRRDDLPPQMLARLV